MRQLNSTSKITVELNYLDLPKYEFDTMHVKCNISINLALVWRIVLFPAYFNYYNFVRFSHVVLKFSHLSFGVT